METYRIHEDAGLYYLTFSVIAWLPVFITDPAFRIITDSLTFCHQEKGLRLNAFVIMPTHLHLIAFDADFDIARLKATLTAFRKYTGQRLCQHVAQACPPAFARVLENTPRTDRSRQFWQQSRHPEGLYTQRFWEQKVVYLHDNPRRKGLVRDVTHWRYSSAAHWLLDPPGETDVPLTAVEW